jgi:hypothetical protein
VLSGDPYDHPGRPQPGPLDHALMAVVPSGVTLGVAGAPGLFANWVDLHPPPSKLSPLLEDAPALDRRSRLAHGAVPALGQSDTGVADAEVVDPRRSGGAGGNASATACGSSGVACGSASEASISVPIGLQHGRDHAADLGRCSGDRPERHTGRIMQSAPGCSRTDTGALRAVLAAEGSEPTVCAAL